jgi:hypothetical protein
LSQIRRCRDLEDTVRFPLAEYIRTYDGKPSYTVSIMEFSGDKVARETQYFADPFEASKWRAQWVERMDT